MQVEKRNETLSPLQALALFNNGFMVTMARHSGASGPDRSRRRSGWPWAATDGREEQRRAGGVRASSMGWRTRAGDPEPERVRVRGLSSESPRPYGRGLWGADMNRRDFLWHSGGGLGGIALAALLGRDGALAADRRPDGGLHHKPKAKRVVQLFMAGGGQPHRPVRLQAGAGQAARPAVGLRRARRGVSERPGPVAQAGLGLQAVRQVRQAAERGGRPARRRGR